MPHNRTHRLPRRPCSLSLCDEQAQLFAIALVPSADRITEEWRNHQQLADRREQECRRQNGRGVAEEALTVAASTTITENRDLSSDTEVSSSPRSGEHGVPRQRDANMSLPLGKDTEADDPRTLGEPRDDANDIEVDSAPDIVEGDSPAPVTEGDETVEGITDQATSQETCDSSRQVEVNREQRKSLPNLKDGSGAGGLGTVQRLSEMLSESSLFEWLDKSDTESSRDEIERRNRETGAGDSLDGKHSDNGPCFEVGHGEKATIVHWIVSRMGLVEKVSTSRRQDWPTNTARRGICSMSWHISRGAIWQRHIVAH